MNLRKLRKLSQHLVNGSFQLCEAEGISCVLANTSNKQTVAQINGLRTDQTIMWLLPEEYGEDLDLGSDLIIPSVTDQLDLISRTKIGLFVAYVGGRIQLEDAVLCLMSQCPAGVIDTVHINSARKMFPWLAERGKMFKNLLGRIPASIFLRLLEIAFKLVKEGKEGKHIGTMFVLGEPASLLQHTKQLILNPLAGHPKKLCNIKNPDFFETIRELSSIDGGFVVSPKGGVLTAGTYFDLPAQQGKLKLGLGARHAAAAAVTKAVDCIAVVISGSASRLSVYYAGKPLLESD